MNADPEDPGGRRWPGSALWRRLRGQPDREPPLTETQAHRARWFTADGAAAPADVCLMLEGTYPYVPGGVSSWVHDILGSFPHRSFALFHIGPRPDAYGEPRFKMPANVLGLSEVYCADPGRGPVPALRHVTRRTYESRVLSALRALHTSDARVDDRMIEDLASGDLTLTEFHHGHESFELICELYERYAGDVPFVEFFWQCRAMHTPLLRLLNAVVPPAGCYHAVSTGYAGLVAAVASARTGRPLLLTEHGLYARERDLEIRRAPWIEDTVSSAIRWSGGVKRSPLRRFWSHFFYRLSHIAYQRAAQIVTLSEVNRRKQVQDGADPAKTMVIPNGVHPEEWDRPPVIDRGASDRPMRVGFVGRVVPIKDVVTLIKACHLALQRTRLELWIIGPEGEDPKYAQGCRQLVTNLGREDHIRFLGPQSTREMYPQLDVLVLTSLSEGQPLVILEGQAAGLPVVSTDVGACRELLEGRDATDASLGPSGIVTRVANPDDTAEALVRLAREPRLRLTMGMRGKERVSRFYQLRDVVARYDALYERMVAP